MTRRRLAFPAFALLLAAAIGAGLPACTYSKDYFRIGADGKKIKASGPITPDELAGNTSPEGEATGASDEGATTGRIGTTGTGGTGGDETIAPPEGTGGTTGEATTGGTGTGGTGNETTPSVAVTKLSAYRRPDFSFVYVAIDRATKKIELFLKTSAADSVAKKLTNMNTEYEQDPRPAVSTDNYSVIFTHTSDWPSMYRVTGLDQPTPDVSLWGTNTGSGASFFADQDKVVFLSPLGLSLRSAKYDGSVNSEESEQDVGFYYGASVNTSVDKAGPFYEKIVFSFDHDEDKHDKPHLFVKDPGVVYPFLFKPLTAASNISETWPAVSPDGKRVAYVRDGYLALCDLHLDAQQNPVCDNTFAFPGLTADNPCWTADGSRIVFSTKKDGNAEIYSVAAGNATELVNLTNSPDTDDVQPACFPNQLVQAKTDSIAPANPQRQSTPVDYMRFKPINP